jgi:magnesium transporter
MIETVVSRSRAAQEGAGSEHGTWETDGRGADSGAGNTLEWIDVFEPSPRELEGIAEQYSLHSTSVKDCLQPEHLPKIETVGNVTFVIVRAFDERCADDADTVQELTRKMALFVGKDFVITIHRQEQPYLCAVKDRWRASAAQGLARSLPRLVNELLRGVVQTYAEPIDDCQARFETLETQTFEPDGPVMSLKTAYVLTREASVYRRMLRAVHDIIAKVDAIPEASVPFFQDLREDTDALYLRASDVVDNVNRILQLQLSLLSQRTNEASQRTNEVMRVLTVFSVFFMPLNLIAGIYGMNFEHMPELKSPWGYHLVLGAMAGITLSIYLWFRRKGWLHRYR